MFALIANGTVAQISAAEFPVAPALVWVDVSVVAPAPQVGWTAAETAGAWTFTAPPAAPTPVQTLAQLATTALSAGLTITLSGTITLVATVFPVDPTTTGKIGAVVTTVIATKAFPGGADAYPMKDAGGNWHTFTIAQYTIVAAAIAAYAASLDLIIDGNPLGATSLPTNSVSLTV